MTIQANEIQAGCLQSRRVWEVARKEAKAGGNCKERFTVSPQTLPIQVGAGGQANRWLASDNVQQDCGFNSESQDYCCQPVKCSDKLLSVQSIHRLLPPE